MRSYGKLYSALKFHYNLDMISKQSLIFLLDASMDRSEFSEYLLLSNIFASNLTINQVSNGPYRKYFVHLIILISDFLMLRLLFDFNCYIRSINDFNFIIQLCLDCFTFNFFSLFFQFL